MGREFLPAMAAHVRQGSRAAMEKRTALAFYKNQEDAQAAGIDVIDACPDGYMSLSTGEGDMAFLRGLCRMLVLDDPALVAVAAADTGLVHIPTNGECGGSMWFWKGILHEYMDAGAPPEAFLLSNVPETMPRLAAIQSATGGLVTDSGIAPLLGLLSDQEIWERSFRHGIALLHADDAHVTAFLVWRGLVFGLYQHHVKALPVERIVHDLSEFRLGWLPDEAVRDAGGHGTAFAHLPPEAEGFPVTYITGKSRRLFSGYGKIIEDTESAFTGCLGLAYAADLR